MTWVLGTSLRGLVGAGTSAGRAVLNGWGFEPNDVAEVEEALHDLEQSYNDEDDT